MTNERDSFIDEVTEEVRRDRLYFYFRRYGWIAALVVLVVVAGTAFTQWRAAQERAEAEAFGDALLAALAPDDSAARALALEGVEVPDSGAARAVRAMLEANEAEQAGEREAAIAALQAVAGDGEVPVLYRDLAGLKALMLADGTMDEADRRTGLETLAQPGAPFALLAAEQLALSDVAAGDTEAALERLRGVVADAGASQGLRDRAQGLIVALGGEVTAAEEAPAGQ